MMILIVFNPMRTFRMRIAGLLNFFTDLRHEKLIRSTPLLDGYEHVALDEYEILRIHRKHRMCKTLGHLWEVEALLPSVTDTHPYTYHLACAACFPHIHSRRIHKTYNLFAISEREQD